MDDKRRDISPMQILNERLQRENRELQQGFEKKEKERAKYEKEIDELRAEKEKAAKKNKSKFVWIVLLLIAVVCLFLDRQEYISLNASYETLQDLYKTLQDQYETLGDQHKALNTDYNNVFDSYSFYRQYAVIMPENSKYYHRYGCEELELEKDFEIRDIESADKLRWACHQCIDE